MSDRQIREYVPREPLERLPEIEAPSGTALIAAVVAAIPWGILARLTCIDVSVACWESR
jgi:hypothetical protein